VYAGVVCLYGLSKIDLVRPLQVFERSSRSQSTKESSVTFEIPGGHRAAYLGAAIGLLLLVNFIYAPTLVGQATHSDEQFEAAMAISEHVESTDRGYPDSAVEAHWADIRMYNYFVNGEAQRYNTNYESFLSADSPDDERTGLREGGNYIVITETEGMASPGYIDLFEGLGVGAGGVESTGHFQAVYVGEEVRAFTVVEGAVIEVTRSDGTEVTAATTVTIDGEEISYERSAVIDDGEAMIRVAHPGKYTVGSETVDVSEEAVLSGENISITVDS